MLIAGSPDFNLSSLKNVMAGLKTHGESYKTHKTHIYAIDKGLEICDKLSLDVYRIVGDFDSVNPDVLQKYPSDIKREFSPKKNISDTELAINMALKQSYKTIYILNATSGRLDHELFNILTLFRAPGRIKIASAKGEIWALRENTIHKIPLKPSTVFSLIPIEYCKGVTIRGAKYNLFSEDIGPNSFTLSNVALGNVKIQFKQGRLLFFKVNKV